MEGIRVHTEDHTCCRSMVGHTPTHHSLSLIPPSLSQVRHDAKASAIRDEACKKLNLPKFKYQLCEVKSSGQKVIFKNDDISIKSSLTVNGRLFIFPQTHSQTTVVSLPPPSPLILSHLSLSI